MKNAEELLQSMSDWVDKISISNDAELLIKINIEVDEYGFSHFEKQEFLSKFRYIIFI